DPANGQTPPYGAAISYWIRRAPNDSGKGPATRADVGKPAALRDTARADTTKKAAPADSVTITIADASGAVVRTMKGPAEAGLDRVWWNLRYDRTREAKLRTSPEHAPWFAVSPSGRP